MIWVIFSVLSGLGDAISYAIIKKLSKLDKMLALASRYLIALPFILLAFLFYDVPKVSLYFYIVVIVDTIVALAGIYLMIESLEHSDISSSIPMLSFSPIFLIVVSFIVLKELPNLFGLTGITMVVIGSYILNIKSIRNGYLEPFRTIFKDKGIFYMFVVSFLFSISATVGKIGILLSNPAYFTFMVYLASSIMILPFCFKNIRKKAVAIKGNVNYILILGISTAAMEILYAIAVKYALVSYTISLKRASVIFSVIIGFFVFKEKNFKVKIAGTILMFAGAALIILS